MVSDPRSKARSQAPEVRNPLAHLPAAARLRSLSPKLRRELAELLHQLSLDARTRAERSWRTHKAPMAVYWKAVSVYAAHLRRLIRPGEARGVPHAADANRQGPGGDHTRAKSEWPDQPLS